MPEIERKFLVRELPPGLGEHRAEPIAQGYLATAPDGVEVRIRRRGDATTLTVKSGPAMVRVEEEIADRGRSLRRALAAHGRAGGSTRSATTSRSTDGLVAELDVYGGALDGLLTAEIEFPSEAAARAFAPPPWLGEEVTGDPAYANQNLAVRRPAPGRPPG